MKKPRHKTEHHVYPKSKEHHRDGFTFDVESIENRLKLDAGTHEAHHRLHSNHTPKEQLRTWFQINRGILSESWWTRIEKMLQEPESEMYRPGLINYE